VLFAVKIKMLLTKVITGRDGFGAVHEGAFGSQHIPLTNRNEPRSAKAVPAERACSGAPIIVARDDRLLKLSGCEMKGERRFRRSPIESFTVAHDTRDSLSTLFSFRENLARLERP